jgi:hypothetical protein
MHVTFYGKSAKNNISKNKKFNKKIIKNNNKNKK